MKKASDGGSEVAAAECRRGGEALCLETFSRGLLACLQRRKTLLRRESQAMINKEKHFSAGNRKKEP